MPFFGRNNDTSMQGANPSKRFWIPMGILITALVLKSAELQSIPHLRHPVRLALLSGDSTLLVANSRSGSISMIELDSQKVTREWKVAREISDMVYIPEHDQILITDPVDHRLITLNHPPSTKTWLPGSELTLPNDPRHMAMHPSGHIAAVGSRWSRRLSLLQPVVLENHTQKWTVTEVVDLTFAPGKMVFLPEHESLLIADAFNGMLAILDLHQHKLISVCNLQVNNIANLSLETNSNEPTIWLSGESLNSYATTFNPEVTWGVLMDNQVRSIPLDQLLDASRSPVHLGNVYGMGDETGPGGDPGTVLIQSNGRLITALQGVDKVAFRPQLSVPHTHRVQVGDRPMDMVMNQAENRLYVANQFSDSVSVIDLESTRILHHISLGPQPELSDIDLGERLFFDANLSLRGWYSCHSCHTDGHTTGMLNDNLGDDHFGAPKRILTLMGAAPTPPYSWLGKVHILETQIAKTLEKTMLHRGSIPDKANLIARFVETLTPPPSIIDARTQKDEALAREGERVFRAAGCHECHKEPHYTSEGTFDVGMVDAAGNHAFNPPSLLGLSQRDSFLHDNRALTVEAVIFENQHPEPRVVPLSMKDRQSLIYFLNTL
jgi:YVTN family beta-propeller protein